MSMIDDIIDSEDNVYDTYICIYIYIYVYIYVYLYIYSTQYSCIDDIDVCIDVGYL